MGSGLVTPKILGIVTDYILPMLRRPAFYQSAALCWRIEGGVPQILLLTSRETRRWVLPKGWPKSGLSAAQTAAEEAWEEAGVQLEHPGHHVGRYTYRKRLKGGVPVETEVDVFAFRTLSIEDEFPERDERERLWTSPQEAARLVDEDDLSRLLAAYRPDAAPATDA